MEILIIGSKGFIGSNTFNYFNSLTEHSTWGCDVIVDYNDPKYFLIDAANPSFQSVFELQKFDVCINCSGAASVPDSLKNPLRDFHLNALNVFKILEAIRKYNSSCKFINLSSAAVYGNPESLPINENAVNKPVSPYGIHKMQSEQICKEFYQFYDIKTCALRIFSAFGNGLKKQLFWDLYQKTKSESEIILWGTGLESRDFIFIQDVISAIEKVITNLDFKGQVINLANGHEILIKDAVDTFYSCFESRIKYRFSGEGRPGDPNNWVADISLLKSIGYSPSFSLEEGLKLYYKWLKESE